MALAIFKVDKLSIFSVIVETINNDKAEQDASKQDVYHEHPLSLHLTPSKENNNYWKQ